MKPAWKLGEISGIGIYVHWSFMILPAWILLGSLAAGSGVVSALTSLTFVVAIFGCVVLHELGHALAARRYGIGTRDITLLPIGGLARLERMPERPSQELVVALAGPAVNVVIAGALFAGLYFASGIVPAFSMSLWGGALLTQLLWVNVSLVLFNLLPAFPMDGGRVVRALLATRLPYVKATQLAAGCGQAMAIAFAIVGFFTNWMLILVALFVYLAARAEAEMVTARSSMEGATVGEAMFRQFRVIPAESRVTEAASELILSPQLDFPVVEGHRLLGMLTKEDILAALANNQGNCAVFEIMRRDVPIVQENDALATQFTQMRTGGYEGLPVVRFDRLVGMLTLEGMEKWAQLHSARRVGDRRAKRPLEWVSHVPMPGKAPVARSL